MRSSLTFTLGVLLASFWTIARTSASPIGCDEAQLHTIGDLDFALSNKAVEIVRLAANASSEAALKKLVDPTATFSLGSGDVGRPLGTYLTGARKLAREMNADSYRFAVWSSIPTPVEDACGSQTVEVEFMDAAHGNSFPVKFTFSHGILVKAEGWAAFFQTGSMRKAEGS